MSKIIFYIMDRNFEHVCRKKCSQKMIENFAKCNQNIDFSVSRCETSVLYEVKLI